MKGKIILLLYIVFGITIGFAQQSFVHTYKIAGPKKLREFFQYSEDRIPLVCAHRGGATHGFPENCIPTFEHTMSQIHAFFEVDPRLTKDSVIVLMHDVTLNRTTNGRGKLSNYTYTEIQNLFLKDPQGKLTKYRVPTLEEVIIWSKGKTILMIDKKDVPLRLILDLVMKHKAESHVLLTVSDPADAKFYYEKNKNLMFEVFIKNEKHLEDFEATGVPWKNMVAYVGQPKHTTLYQKIREKGMMVMLYSAPKLEKVGDEISRILGYKKAFSDGCDIVLADRAVEVYTALKEFAPIKSKKRKYFSHTSLY